MDEFERVPSEVLDKLRTVSTATVTGLLLKMGIRNTFMEGLYPLSAGQVLVGQAFTLRCLPKREDIEDARGAKPRPQRQAVESVGPGDVLVVEARGHLGCGTAGDILLTRIKERGAAGFVTDGALRDTPYISTMEFPVYVAGANAQPSTRDLTDYGINEAIACGGVAVLPGDVILGDGDGVAVIPARYARQIADEGWEKERLESYIRSRVEEGVSTFDAYPPTAAFLQEYAEWLKSQNLE